MPNLKDLKVRINSVKSTQKITSAMKMVAAAKLRRAQESAEAARPYAEKMERMVADVGESIGGIEGAPPLLVGTGSTQTHLIVACTADRGLCGGFNGTIIREVRTLAHNLKRDGKIVRILCVGRKGRDGLKRQFEADIVETIEGIGRRSVEFADAQKVAEPLTTMFDAGGFDGCRPRDGRRRSRQRQCRGRRHRAIGDFRLRAGGAGNPGRPAAQEHQPAGFPGAIGERGLRARRTDDVHGQRDAQRRRNDRRLDADLQPHPSGGNHQGTGRNYLGRGSALRRIRDG